MEYQEDPEQDEPEDGGAHEERAPHTCRSSKEVEAADTILVCFGRAIRRHQVRTAKRLDVGR